MGIFDDAMKSIGALVGVVVIIGLIVFVARRLKQTANTTATSADNNIKNMFKNATDLTN